MVPRTRFEPTTNGSVTRNSLFFHFLNKSTNYKKKVIDSSFDDA
jgi:hypothetical protein